MKTGIVVAGVVLIVMLGLLALGLYLGHAWLSR